ncbi:MAG: urate hydroxylase PuuD [Sandaracinaceae bacterium]|nr:urate hydroxylase PuuD [Sandaracinaceae bacterium]
MALADPALAPHHLRSRAWIGTSFYFNWLNNHVRPVEGGPTPEGVAGELWSVHGGKFYQVVKYKVAPPTLPRTLHWFKYEAYFTWVTGFFLLAIVYYLEPTAYLVDANVPLLRSLLPGDLLEIGAVATGVLVLAVGWVVYHYLCKSPLGRMPVALAILGFALMTGVAFGLHADLRQPRGVHPRRRADRDDRGVERLLRDHPEPEADGRGHERGEGARGQARRGRGAALAPQQLLHAPRAVHHGEQPLPDDLRPRAQLGGARGAVAHRRGGPPLVQLARTGPQERVAPARLRGGHRGAGARELAAGLELRGEVTFAMVRDIVERRCVECHSAAPTSALYDAAPQGVMFDTPQQIADRAARIHTQVVVTQQMPLSNLTNMTDEERAIIGAWYRRGASLD